MSRLKTELPREALERATELARELSAILSARQACARDARALQSERAAEAVVFMALGRIAFHEHSAEELPLIRDASQRIERTTFHRAPFRARRR
jgi:hypothetical protein